MKVSLDSLRHSLYQGEAECWFASESSAVSYPTDGNETCFSIEDVSVWFQHRNACLTALMTRLPPSGTVFDVGGGNGVVSEAMQRAGFDVVLIEPGRTGALNARRRGVPTVVCATLEETGFEPETLPAIGIFDVLEHIEDDGAFLALLRSRLISRGRLYLTVPSYMALWSNEDIDAGHYRRYTLSSLERRLNEAGFRVEFSSYMFWILPAPILLLRTIPSLWGRRRGKKNAHVTRDHAGAQTQQGNLLQSLLAPEIDWIRQGRRIPVGSSCLVAAIRTD